MVSELEKMMAGALRDLLSDIEQGVDPLAKEWRQQLISRAKKGSYDKGKEALAAYDQKAKEQRHEQY